MEGLKFSTIFLFLLIGLANAELTCPEYNNEEETYLPSDTNCNEYFHCVHGVPVMRKCPEGLQWDQAKNICNWPDQISPPCTGIFYLKIKRQYKRHMKLYYISGLIVVRFDTLIYF